MEPSVGASVGASVDGSGAPSAPSASSAQRPAKDWAWRAKIRANPRTRAIYRAFVGVLGTAVCLLGLVLIPAPGPGWALVFLGLAILGSEFVWAQRLLRFARRQVGRWTSWAMRQPPIVRMLLGLASFALLVGLVWLTLRLTGLPGFVPQSWVPSWTGVTTG
jgi:uncharacterized protein (TIGR02611 family)